MRAQKGCAHLDADGAHAGAAAAVGDAEGLVQVQVAHVRADVPGGGQAHLRMVPCSTIQIRAPSMCEVGGCAAERAQKAASSNWQMAAHRYQRMAGVQTL